MQFCLLRFSVLILWSQCLRCCISEDKCCSRYRCSACCYRCYYLACCYRCYCSACFNRCFYLAFWCSASCCLRKDSCPVSDSSFSLLILACQVAFSSCYCRWVIKVDIFYSQSMQALTYSSFFIIFSPHYQIYPSFLSCLFFRSETYSNRQLFMPSKLSKAYFNYPHSFPLLQASPKYSPFINYNHQTITPLYYSLYLPTDKTRSCSSFLWMVSCLKAQSVVGGGCGWCVRGRGDEYCENVALGAMVSVFFTSSSSSLRDSISDYRCMMTYLFCRMELQCSAMICLQLSSQSSPTDLLYDIIFKPIDPFSFYIVSSFSFSSFCKFQRIYIIIPPQSSLSPMIFSYSALNYSTPTALASLSCSICSLSAYFQRIKVSMFQLLSASSCWREDNTYIKLLSPASLSVGYSLWRSSYLIYAYSACCFTLACYRMQNYCYSPCLAVFMNSYRCCFKFQMESSSSSCSCSLVWRVFLMAQSYSDFCSNKVYSSQAMLLLSVILSCSEERIYYKRDFLRISSIQVGQDQDQPFQAMFSAVCLIFQKSWRMELAYDCYNWAFSYCSR